MKMSYKVLNHFSFELIFLDSFFFCLELDVQQKETFAGFTGYDS